MIFDLVHVLCRETPIVVTQVVEARKRVSFHATGEIDVGIKVAPDQLPESAKHRLAAVQSRVARTGYGTPQAVRLKNINHMIQKIPRFHVEQQRSVTMLLQNHCGCDSSFQAMSFIAFHNLAKRTHSASLSLPVVGHRGQPPLDLCGRAQMLNKLPFVSCESLWLGSLTH